MGTQYCVKSLGKGMHYNERECVWHAHSLSILFFLCLHISFPGVSYYTRRSRNRVRRHRFRRNQGNSELAWAGDPQSPMIYLVCLLYSTMSVTFFLQDVRDSMPVFQQKRHDIYELHEVKKANLSPNPNSNTKPQH